MTITATSDNQIRKSNIRNWTIGLQNFATGSLPRSGLVQRDLWNVERVSPWSVAFGAGELDHLGPLLGFCGDEISKVSGRTGNHRVAQVGKLRLDLGIGQGDVDFPVELFDDRCGSLPGRTDPLPAADLVA